MGSILYFSKIRGLRGTHRTQPIYAPAIICTTHFKLIVPALSFLWLILFKIFSQVHLTTRGIIVMGSEGSVGSMEPMDFLKV